MQTPAPLLYPVEPVFAPDWWHRNEGFYFDADFFFHPARRVEDERRMEQALYERFGRHGLGAGRKEDRPVAGAVHLAAGYLLSEMLGCRVEYLPDRPPQVHPAGCPCGPVDVDAAFASDAFRRFSRLCDTLKTRHGRLEGDVNWSGVLNLAMDRCGETLLMDMLDRPDAVTDMFTGLAGLIDRFTRGVEHETGSTSISVNRNVLHRPGAVFLHSECSHTMISTDLYDRFLLPLDIAWSRSRRPFGIHYCGRDPHRFAASFAKIPNLDFLDVGWGGDVALLRKHLPDTFLNIRLNPTELPGMTPEQIRETMVSLADASGHPALTGFCCVNLDATVRDEQIDAMFETAAALRARAAA